MTSDDSLNLGLVLEIAVNGGENRTGLTFTGDSWSYVELADLAQRWRQHLLSLGYTHVTAVGENHPGIAGLLFGASLAGVNVSLANPRLKANELLHAFKTTSSDAVYLWNVRSAAPAEAISALTPAPSLFEMATAEPPPAVRRGGSAPAGSDACLYVFTSGTTSLPKAVILPQRALVEYLLNSYAPATASADEANLITAPLFHIAGIMNMLSSLFMLRRIVLLPRFDALEWLRTAREERVTHAFLVPTMLKQVVQTLRARPDLYPKALRSIAYGGAPSRPADVLAALEVFVGVDFVGAFGLTETSSTVCVLGPEDHEQARRSSQPEEILASVGRPIQGVEVAIAGPNGESTPGVEGEVVIRGAQVSPGYLNADSRVDTDGWLHTGDLGVFDQHGRLHLVGRVDDMIQRGGENVSPLEVEAAFTACRGVAEVAAVGVPDETWGQAVVLAVVADGSVQSVDLTGALQACAGQTLAAHKRPAHYLFLDELPRNALGKLVRVDVKELAMRAYPAPSSTAERS